MKVVFFSHWSALPFSLFVFFSYFVVRSPYFLHSLNIVFHFCCYFLSLHEEVVKKYIIMGLKRKKGKKKLVKGKARAQVGNLL